MKSTLVAAGLGAAALFAAYLGILPVRGTAPPVMQRPAIQALNPQPLPPLWQPPAHLPPDGVGIA
jgi:hypothetical protein